MARDAMRRLENMFLIVGALVLNICFSLCAHSPVSSSSSSSSDLSDNSSSDSNSNDYSGGCEKKFVCYFTSWATYRPGGWAYTIDTLNPHLCTHYIYAFAVVDPNTFKVVPSDPDLDIKKDYYKKFCDNVKAAGNYPLLAVGGWNESNGTKWENLLKDSKKQDQFIISVIEIFKTYGFVGLELDYEYPGCPQGIALDSSDCKDPETKNRFTGFVKRINKAFESQYWLVAVSVPASSERLTYSYDLVGLQEYVDWFDVMGYEYFPTSTKVTYLHSPKIPQPNASKKLCVDYTIKFMLDCGVSADKIVLGMGLYGKGYTLKDPKQHTINSPAIGPSKEGEVTREAGVLSFYEICMRKRSGWTMETQYQGKYYGRWISKDDQWVGYDAIPELKAKTKLIENKGLGGGMIWALDHDDFRGKCEGGKSPLTTFLSQQLLSDCR